MLAGCFLAGCQTDATGTATASPPPPLALLQPPSTSSALLGWEPTAVTSLYGKPVFVRKEKDSELWRYDGQNCAAFIFFYQEQAGMRVRHVETLPQGQGVMADAACLAGIKARASATS